MYKSLEHIIREIKEGKSSSEKKKDSLEGAIRKVHRKEYESSYAARDSKPVDEDDIKLAKDYDESIKEMNVVTNPGGEMTGRQFSTRSPIIAPRKDSDDGHGQSSKNVSIQRNKAIQKFSAKNTSLSGKISEADLNEAPGLPPLRVPMKIAQPKVTQKPFAEPPPKIELPPVGPETPATPVKTPTKTPTMETPPKAPPVESPPKIEMPSKAPAVEAPPKIQTPTETPQKTPTVETPTKLKTPTEPLPKETPKTKIPNEPPAGGGNFPPALSPGKKGGIKLPGMGFFSAKPVELTGPHAPVKTSLGKHTHIRAIKNVYKEEVEGLERKKIQDMPRKNAGDRHDIEYVGRKNADPKTSAEKTSRQAQYKIKVIDEAKKLADVVKKVRKESGEGKTKVYDNVVINPDLNRIDNRDPQN